MSLPTTGRRENKITCAPDSLTNCPKALKSLLIALGPLQFHHHPRGRAVIVSTSRAIPE